MKLDPGMHIGLHLVFFGKTGVTDSYTSIQGGRVGRRRRRRKEEDEATEEPPVAQDRPVRRSLSPAAKRQRELVLKMTEDALRQGLEAQRAVAATQEKMPVLNRSRFFRPKPRVPAVAR
jgi:hypothetical protein